MIEALKSYPTHSENFTKFDQGLATVFGRDVVDQWVAEVKAWEADFSQPCPYDAPVTSQMTITEIRIDLEKEEQAALARNPEAIVQESTASTMLVLGLEIESLQYVRCFSLIIDAPSILSGVHWHGKLRHVIPVQLTSNSTLKSGALVGYIQVHSICLIIYLQISYVALKSFAVYSKHICPTSKNFYHPNSSNVSMLLPMSSSPRRLNYTCHQNFQQNIV